jgi:glutamate synthase (NADPH/NADH) large chain
MTGGRVIVLGPTGRNFAAGMSGGIAYVWDPESCFERQCNTEMVELDSLESVTEILEIRSLIERHVAYTDSSVGRAVLANWEKSVRQFVRVMPTDYKRVLEAREAAVSAG